MFVPSSEQCNIVQLRKKISYTLVRVLFCWSSLWLISWSTIKLLACISEFHESVSIILHGMNFCN
jgi:hypothetical protein